MISVGVRELKAQASELLRRVREKGEVIEITYHGQPSARLVPLVPPTPDEASVQRLLVSLDELATEIGTAWQGGDATATVQEGRRTL